MPPEEAANASRVHFEYDVLQIEAGVEKSVTDKLSKEFKLNLWTEKNLYFGGVHIATPDKGGGDKRRTGAVIVK